MPENDTDKPSAVTESAPSDAFALVGHEIRAEIIQVLGENPHENKLPFSELRSRMSTDVDPSQLHYHLQELVGHFIENTDGGYALRPSGANLCLALRAGTFDRRNERISVDTDIDCHYCQGRIVARFTDGVAKIFCSSCRFSYGVGFLGVPLEKFEDEAGAFSHLCGYMAVQTVFLSYGICPSCVNSLNPVLQSRQRDSKPSKVRIFQPCDLCGANWSLPVGRALLTDPGIIAFCDEHDMDVLSTPFWELEFAATDKHVTVRSNDPWEVTLEVTFDDDTLELVVDGDLNVLERNRLATHGEQGTALLDEVLLPENDACFQALRRLRWPDGVVCTNCSSQDTVKIGATPKGAQRYQCQTCDSTFNDLTGTIFADRRFSLPEMFYIIRQMNEENAKRIAQQIERSYKPVLSFVHEVRDMNDEDLEFNL